MKNVKVVISYDGTAYNGYQSQPDGNTIQDKIQLVMSKLLNQPMIINGCSRTDAGVHAKEFVFNAEYDETQSSIDLNGLIRGMNGLLPEDIAVYSCEYVPHDFHARFSSKGKEYLYIIDTSKVRNVFLNNLVMHYP